MNKRLKIVLGFVIFLGILSGAFLLFAKKKEAPLATPKVVTASAPVNSLTPLPAQQNKTTGEKTNPTVQSGLPPVAVPAAKAPAVKTVDKKTIVQSQWTKCKNKTLPTSTNLFWNVQITEGIPINGTYAKGNLYNDVSFPVHVIVKADSAITDKIKAMLVVGKAAFLRGTCTDVAADGSVVLQAF